MKVKRILLYVFGTILSLLGSLWFLQGIDVIRLKPIACVADCQEISGGSLLWAVVGFIVLAMGASLVYIGFAKNKKRNNI